MKKEKKVFWVSPLGLHPNPLPKGEGVYLQNLGALVDQGLGVVDQNDQFAPASQSRRAFMPREKERSGAIMRLALLKQDYMVNPYPDAPAQRTSNTGTWIDRHRSRRDYN